MTKIPEIYKCSICSNVVEITHSGEGSLVCCGKEMDLLKENIPDERNAHYAFVEQIDDLTKKVTIKHIMTKEHHIEYVEIISNNNKYLKRKFFDETESCEFTFRCDCNDFYIRLYCNLDGVWVTRQ